MSQRSHNATLKMRQTIRISSIAAHSCLFFFFFNSPAPPRFLPSSPPRLSPDLSPLFPPAGPGGGGPVGGRGSAPRRPAVTPLQPLFAKPPPPPIPVPKKLKGVPPGHAASP